MRNNFTISNVIAALMLIQRESINVEKSMFEAMTAGVDNVLQITITILSKDKFHSKSI